MWVAPLRSLNSGGVAQAHGGIHGGGQPRRAAAFYGWKFFAAGGAAGSLLLWNSKYRVREEGTALALTQVPTELMGQVPPVHARIYT